MGFGIFEDGFIQLVNPDEYEFVFDYIDKLLEPSIVFGITALGDLLIWEGNNNWTVAPDEGNRILFINIRKCTSEILGDMDFLLNFTLGDETAIKDKEYFNSLPYLNIKGNYQLYNMDNAMVMFQLWHWEAEHLIKICKL